MSNPNPSPETRFKPGVSGNPGGRPKFSLTKLMIRQLEDRPDQVEEIIKWLIANRKDLVWNKIDPNPPTDLNLGGEVKLPFTFIVEKLNGERKEG